MSERISPENTLKGFRLATTPVSDPGLSVVVGQALSISLLPSKEAFAAIVTKISSHDIRLDLSYITPDSVPPVGSQFLSDTGIRKPPIPLTLKSSR